MKLIMIVLLVAAASSCSMLNNLTSGANNQNSVEAQKQEASAKTKKRADETRNQLSQEYQKFTPLQVGKYDLFEIDGIFLPKNYGALERKNVKYWGENSDNIRVGVLKYASEAKAKQGFKEWLGKAFPIENTTALKPPKCNPNAGEGESVDGPMKIVKRYKQPNGNEVVVVRSGDFYDATCDITNNEDEFAIWNDGVYFIVIWADTTDRYKNPEKYISGFGRAESFAKEYFAALNQPLS